MAAASALYWSQSNNPDSIYLKNQRQWIQKNFSEYLGGQLHIHKNAAFLVMDEDVLFFCGLVREKADAGVWMKRQDECIVVCDKEFQEVLYDCRNRYSLSWGKEYREMEDASYWQRLFLK